MSNVAVETLLQKRQQLLGEQQKANDQYIRWIADIDVTIKLLQSGYSVSGDVNTSAYDDEHPDYIKASQEEI